MSFVPPRASFLTLGTIERSTEDHLRAAGLMPTAQHPVVDIEAFIESYLKARLDQFATLDPTILGVTTFSPGKAPLVEINRDLSEAAELEVVPWVLGRWRITLAHEASHVIFHRRDYEGNDQPQLFDSPQPDAPRLHRCLKRDLHQVSNRIDPREYQANLGMAALLMPRAVFSELASPLFSQLSPSADWADLQHDRKYLDIVSELAARFQVSKEAARIRIEKLGLRAAIGQEQMSF